MEKIMRCDGFDKPAARNFFVAMSDEARMTNDERLKSLVIRRSPFVIFLLQAIFCSAIE
jgi:hypothetical protein